MLQKHTGSNLAVALGWLTDDDTSLEQAGEGFQSTHLNFGQSSARSIVSWGIFETFFRPVHPIPATTRTSEMNGKFSTTLMMSTSLNCSSFKPVAKVPWEGSQLGAAIKLQLLQTWHLLHILRGGVSLLACIFNSSSR